MIGRRRLVGYGIAAGALGGVGVGDALVSRSVARARRPDIGSGDHAPSAGDRGASAQAFDTAPAHGVLKRLLPAHASQIELSAIAAADDVDRFRIRRPLLTDAGTNTSAEPWNPPAVTVEGTSTSALLTGVSWYLKYVAGVTIGLPGDSLSRLPQVLPTPEATPHTGAAHISGAAVVKHRFALNDTENGYAGPLIWTPS